MFCHPDEDFLNVNQYWNTTDPDFSECFHKTVLLWIPCGFLLLLAPARMLILHRSEQKFIIPWSWKSRLKLGLAFVIGLLGALDIGCGLYEHFSGSTVPVVNFLSPLILTLTMVVYGLVVYMERKNSIRSSGFLFNFWFIMFLLSMVTFRSKIRVTLLEGKVTDMFRFVTYYIFFAATLVQLVVSMLVDKQPVGAVPIEDENPCPEPHVSFLSQITFWWFSGLVVLGYKRPLVRTDLWNLNFSDKCKSVMAKFQKNWVPELSKCKRTHEVHESGSNTVPAHKDIEMKEMGGASNGSKDTPNVKIIQRECNKKKPRLFWAMLKTFWFKSFLGAVYKFMFDILQFASPLILKYMIAYTRDKNQETWKGYWYAGVMLAVVLFQSVVLHQYFQNCTIVGMRLRTAIIGAVYEKMLRLSNSARKSSTVGEIVNLMSVDAQRFNDMMTYINMIWSGPLQIIISIYFLWVTLGPSIMAGLAVMIILIPLNALIANKVKQFQVKQMNLKDKRIKMMNEILNGIKVLKLYAWEGSFEEKILEIRNKELAVLKRMSYLNACSTFMWTVAPVAVCLVTFAVYVLVDENNILDAEKAFVSLSLFNILRFPLSMLPMVISNIVQVRVSLSRLRNFLGNDELDSDAVTSDPNAKHTVSIKNGEFVWDETTGSALKNINLDVPTGDLIAVVGSVGSGKSSLLQAILGEMEKANGDVTVKGSIAYVAQQAWIQNATLQENILFGKSADVGAYRSAIEACALQPDLDIMPAGDQTEIGEKGINLSGGQKQRVSLARAVYQDRDLYLLDDPLSAVDSHVGKHIFDNVIGPNGVLKGKTRVLVTHGVGYLPYVDTIVVLVDGRISEIGSYKQLLDHDGAFAQFLKNYLSEEMEKQNVEDMELDEETISQIGSIIGQSTALQRQMSVLSERMRTVSAVSGTPPGTPDASRRTPGTPNLNRNASGSKSHLASNRSLHEVPNGVGKQAEEKKEEEKKLIEAEKMETQRVKMSVFLAYVKSVGVLLSVLTTLFYVLYNAANLYSNIWLSEWSNDATIIRQAQQPTNTSGNTTVAPIDTTDMRDLRLGVYGALGFVQGVFILAACIALFTGSVNAGKALHSILMHNIIASPMSFFDTTPSGRILNRFGKDIDVIDAQLAINIQAWFLSLLRVLCVPIVIGMSTPLFLTVIIPVCILYYVVQEYLSLLLL